jgi:hypothetical protein
MRRYSDVQGHRQSASELNRIARRLLLDVRLYESEHHRVDHELADAELARAIARTILTADPKRRWRASDLRELKRLLVEAHLEIVLDEIVDSAADHHIVDDLFDQGIADDSNLGDAVGLDEATILHWIESDRQARALKLAELVPYALTGDQGASLFWSPLALAIVRAAPEPIAVLCVFESRFYNGVSRGPFYLRLERRLALVDTLRDDRDLAVRRWASDARRRLEDMISRWQERDRERESRFE